MLYIAEEDAYYIYYSGTTASIQDRIGLATSAGKRWRPVIAVSQHRTAGWVQLNEASRAPHQGPTVQDSFHKGDASDQRRPCWPCRRIAGMPLVLDIARRR